MPDPVRLRLSRARGFNLQAHSLATNGLPAINVARPSRYGNPIKVSPTFSPEQAVAMFEAHAALMKLDASALRGCNVACFCSLDQVCHGDVWLRLART